VVAAADLSHVGPAFGGQPLDLVGRALVRAADGRLIERMCAGDAAGFLSEITQVGDRYNVCGLPPIYLALRILGEVSGEAVAYELAPADHAGTSVVSICGLLWH
ncbi:MAG: MEMO1 family protein, partial [Chloroflexi bacterium]|nr:MEMO1 family protein [Chloroflexota bacterium]